MKRLAISILVAIVAANPALGQVAVEAADASSKVIKVIAENATAAQRQWLAASPEQRIKLAEDLGEEGARAMAKKQGLKPLMNGLGKTLPQGPDQVYRAADGVVHVFEAKGGSSQIGRAYGYPQGSSEWAVKSAERVFRSGKATAAERQAAKAILDAAAKGKLEVHVVRTSHVLGEPTTTVVQQSVRCTDDAARLAQSALDDLARAGVQATDDATRVGVNLADDAGRAGVSTVDDAARAGANVTDDLARAGNAVSKVGNVAKGAAKVAAKVAVPVAVAFDLGFRIEDGMDTEDRFQAGEITQQEREIEHAKNAAGMAGGWAGAFVGAKLGGAGGAAAGSCVAPGPGTAIGGVAGAVAGGVAGYFGGEAAAEAGAEWAVDKVHATGTTIAETGGAVWDGTKGAADWTADKACQAGQAVSDGASGGWDEAKAAGQWVGSKATDTWKWVWGD